MDQFRIRRRNEFPPFAREEARRRAAYRRTQSFIWGGLPVTLKFRLSRWSWLEEVVQGIRYQSMFCWVVVQRKRVAAFKFFEYEMSFDLDNEQLYELMDSESFIAGNLAEIICGAWDYFSDNVSAHGSLLDFRMAWSDPVRGPHGLWRRLCSSFLKSLRRAALEILGPIGDPNSPRALQRPGGPSLRCSVWLSELPA
jgi:hypothetical protein